MGLLDSTTMQLQLSLGIFWLLAAAEANGRDREWCKGIDIISECDDELAGFCPSICGMSSSQKAAEEGNIAVTNSTKSGCDYPWLLLGQRCYLFSTDIGENDRDWSDARAFCKLHSGDLATAGRDLLTDYDKLLFHIKYMTELGTNREAWLGAKKDGAGYWYWVDNRGLPYDSNMWDPIEPSNANANGDCLSSYKADGSRRVYADDYPCAASRPFVCEK